MTDLDAALSDLAAVPHLLVALDFDGVLAPIVASVVQLSISRQREYLADATSALTTRHPHALARALLKLESAGRPMQRQNSSMAHLWIADPSKPGVVARLFATHPPIADRVARLSEMGSRF